MSVTSLVRALKVLAAHPPAVLAPCDLDVLDKLARISLEPLKGEEARLAGVFAAFVSLGRVFPVEAVSSVCWFILLPAHIDAFCSLGGTEVIIAAFERACQF